jgi:hypothetical protein
MSKSDLVPEEAIDYAEVYRRGGANLGDEDFAFFRCPYCRRVYLLDYEVDTVYLEPADLSRRVPVYDEGFTCVACGQQVPGDQAWIGKAARPAFGATWEDLAGSGWEWAILGKRSIPGQAVAEALAGPMETRDGLELPGIAGSVWHYADLLVRLSSGRVLSLAPPRSYLLNGALPGTTSCQLLDDAGKTSIGKRVIDLLAPANGEPGLFLMLEGGSYLEHSYGPGGSCHCFGNLRDWTADELDEEVVSQISGKNHTWKSFMASPPESP